MHARRFRLWRRYVVQLCGPTPGEFSAEWSAVRRRNACARTQLARNPLRTHNFTENLCGDRWYAAVFCCGIVFVSEDLVLER